MLLAQSLKSSALPHQQSLCPGYSMAIVHHVLGVLHVKAEESTWYICSFWCGGITPKTELHQRHRIEAMYKCMPTAAMIIYQE